MQGHLLSFALFLKIVYEFLPVEFGGDKNRGQKKRSWGDWALPMTHCTGFWGTAGTRTTMGWLRNWTNFSTYVSVSSVNGGSLTGLTYLTGDCDTWPHWMSSFRWKHSMRENSTGSYFTGELPSQEMEVRDQPEGVSWVELCPLKKICWNFNQPPPPCNISEHNLI